MLHCLDNIATFMEALPMDSPSNLWTTICNQFQTFLTKLPAVLPLKVFKLLAYLTFRFEFTVHDLTFFFHVST